jgi:hypothetical protein
MPDPNPDGFDVHDDDSTSYDPGDHHIDWSEVDKLAERMAIVDANDEDQLLDFYDELAGHPPRRVPGGLHGTA